MLSHSDELRGKTRVLTAAVIVTNVMGNFALSMGMKEVGETVTVSVLPYLRALLDPWVIAGVCLLGLWLFSNLSLLSWADLSYVLPVTSIAYVIAAILGRVFMGDPVTPLRWAGILLIVTGAIIVGRTTPRTTPEREQDR
jgi:drug/metabolite transporter (DMT)-like permease